MLLDSICRITRPSTCPMARSLTCRMVRACCSHQTLLPWNDDGIECSTANPAVDPDVLSFLVTEFSVGPDSVGIGTAISMPFKCPSWLSAHAAAAVLPVDSSAWSIPLSCYDARGKSHPLMPRSEPEVFRA